MKTDESLKKLFWYIGWGCGFRWSHFYCHPKNCPVVKISQLLIQLVDYSFDSVIAIDTPTLQPYLSLAARMFVSLSLDLPSMARCLAYFLLA